MATRATAKCAGLQISYHQEDQRGLLIAKGKLTVTTIPQVDQAVRAMFQSGASSVILDLSGISDVDASGIGALVKIYDQAFHRGVDVRFVIPPGRLSELIELAKLERVLPIFPDLHAATVHELSA